MNINSSSTTINNPQIINFPRPLIDRKPDDEQTAHTAVRYVNSNQSAMTPSSTSATVPQTVSILNPLISINGAAISSANGVIVAKKCAFHRQCPHIHQSQIQNQQQQPGNQQSGHQQNIIQHQIQLPLQTASTTTVQPPQIHPHPQQPQQQQQFNHQQHIQLQQQLQQNQQQAQQIRINNNNSNVSIASTAASAAITVVNRTSTQPKRDAISTNIIAPQLNAALLQDRYLLLDMVDGSSFYKCIDIQTQKMLVCKIVNNPCANLLTAHFRLDGHPNVNYLEKVIQNTSQTYLFFEPSQGDLHSHVRVRKRLRENEARRLFRQMCEVAKTCHEQGIVLRDLKLRKFVFADSERTQIKLESLEDAVVLDNPAEDILEDKRGCPAYVSPELLRANTAYSGKAADMWSLGVILYTMLVGKYPFNDSEHASLFAKISRGIYVVPDCLSSKARCIIRALLRRDPEERITSEDVLYHPWLRHDDESREVVNSKSNLSSGDDQCVPEWYANQDDEGEVPSM